MKIRLSKSIFGEDFREESFRLPHPKKLKAIMPCGFDFDSHLIKIGSRPLSGDEIVRDSDTLEVLRLPGEPTTAALFALSAVLATANLAFNILLAPREPDSAEDEDAEIGFSGTQTRAGVGDPLPILWGRRRVPLHIVQSFFEPRFSLEADVEGVARVALDTEIEGNEATFSTLGIVSQGPIKGMDVESIFIDGDSIDQFPGISSEYNLGEFSQATLDGFDDSVGARSVGRELLFNNTLTEQSDGAVDRVDIEIVFPNGLYRLDNNKIGSASVEFRLDVDGQSVATFSLSAASRGTIQRFIRGPRVNFAESSVSLTRLTADADPDVSTDPVDACRWESITSVVRGERNRPGVALLGLRSVPQSQTGIFRNASIIAEGISECVTLPDGPSGDVEYAYTRNPAWIALTFIVSPRYGGGRWYRLTDCDLDSFCQAAAYCDAQGFYFDFLQSSRITGNQFLRMIARAAGCHIVEIGGGWRMLPITQAEPVCYFTEATYFSESLEYVQDISGDAPTRMVAAIENEDNEYSRDDAEYLFELDENDGESLTEFVNLQGVTSKRHAEKICHLELKRLNLENQQVSFTTTGEAALKLQIGDAFGLSTPTGQAGIASGRLTRVSGDKQYLYIDNEVELFAGDVYEILVIHEGGLTVERFEVEEDEVTNIIKVRPRNWKPQAGDEYSVGLLTQSHKTFWLSEKSVEENGTVRLSGFLYVEEARTLDGEYGAPRIDRRLLPGDNIPGPVRGLFVLQRGDCMDLAWQAPIESGATAYRIWVSENGGAWTLGGTTSATSFCYSGDLLLDSYYRFAVASVGITGKAMAPQSSPAVGITAF